MGFRDGRLWLAAVIMRRHVKIMSNVQGLGPSVAYDPVLPSSVQPAAPVPHV